MDRRAGISIIAAIGFLLAACTSSGSGADSSGQDVNSGATSRAVPSAGTSAATVAVATPVVLDAQTITWFDTLCTGLTRSLQNLGSPGLGLAEPSLSQSTIVTDVQGAGAAFQATAESLAATPPPTFEGGQGFATGFTSGLAAAAAAFPQSAATFAALDPNDAGGLAAGKTALQNELLTALAPPLQSVRGLPQDLLATVKVITSCQAFIG